MNLMKDTQSMTKVEKIHVLNFEHNAQCILSEELNVTLCVLSSIENKESGRSGSRWFLNVI